MTALIFLDVDGVLNTASTSASPFCPPLDSSLTRNLAALCRAVAQKREVSPTADVEAGNVAGDGAEEGDVAVGIVVSSTWRYSSYLDHLKAHLVSCGIPAAFIIGVTPDLSNGGSLSPFPPESSHYTRTDEILLWLYVNGKWGLRAHGQAGESEGGKGECEEDSQWAHASSFAGGRVPRHVWVRHRPLPVSSFLCIDDLPLHRESCYADRAAMEAHLLLTDVTCGLTEARVGEGEAKLTALFSFESWATRVFGPCDNPKCLHRMKGEGEKEEEEEMKKGEEEEGRETEKERERMSVPSCCGLM